MRRDIQCFHTTSDLAIKCFNIETLESKRQGINVFNMKKKALDDDLMFFYSTWTRFSAGIYSAGLCWSPVNWEQGSSTTFSEKSSCLTSSDSGSNSECAVWWPWVIPGDGMGGYIKNREVISRIGTKCKQFFVVWTDLNTVIRKHHHVDKVLHVGHLKVIFRWSSLSSLSS